MNDKTLHLTGSVILKSDAPAELKSLADDCDVMAYASVEAVDRDSDIVRVAGISLANHRAESPVKLLASHQRTLPNGESPVIGRVTGFKQVTHKSLNVPALAFAAKFAPTPLGKHYKSLYDSGDMTDFSIGFRPVKAEPIKDGGLDYQSTELMEISAVALPANQHAAVMRAMEETYPQVAGNGWIMPPEIAKDFDEWRKAGCPPLRLEFITYFKQLEDRINLRLDDLEDAIVGTSQAAEQKSDPTPPPSAKSESEPTPEQIAALYGALKALRK